MCSCMRPHISCVCKINWTMRTLICNNHLFHRLVKDLRIGTRSRNVEKARNRHITPREVNNARHSQVHAQKTVMNIQHGRINPTERNVSRSVQSSITSFVNRNKRARQERRRKKLATTLRRSIHDCHDQWL